MEYPCHVGLGSFGRSRPSMKIVRKLFDTSYRTVTSVGVWTIRSGPLNVIMGPGGRHSVAQESAAGFAARSRDLACAHGCASDDLKSVSYFTSGCQSPERSGLPSAVR